jgi:SAM-dependent methyltransferase
LPRIAREEGRRLFGSDAAAYELARPGHAERVYEVLVERCGLVAGTRVLEIGPGTGQATRRLLELGAEPLVVVEPDPQLAAFLRETLGTRIELHETALEEAELPASAFHLAAAASSFHWIDEHLGLARISSALLAGGWFAMWWTLFGERGKPDAHRPPRGAEADGDPRRDRAHRAGGLRRPRRANAGDVALHGPTKHERALTRRAGSRQTLRAL